MITREQYLEILNAHEDYTAAYKKTFPNKPMSNDFVDGLLRSLDIIEGLVKK